MIYRIFSSGKSLLFFLLIAYESFFFPPSYRLGELAIPWKSIPPSSQGELESLLLKTAKDLTHVNLSDLLMGSVGINYCWHQNLPMKQAIYHRIIEIYGPTTNNNNNNINDKNSKNAPVTEDLERYKSTLANIDYCMGKIGIEKDDLNKEVFQALIHGLKKYQLVFTPYQKNQLIFG